MSQSLARAFVFGEKLSDTFKNIARSLLVNIIGALIEIVARKGVELAIEKLITREKQKQAALSSVSGSGSLFSTARSFLGFAKGGAVSKGQTSCSWRTRCRIICTKSNRTNYTIS